MAAWSPKGSHATSARVHTAGESQSHQSHSGRQTELGRPGRAQVGGDFSRVPPAPEAPPPKKRSGPSQGTPEGRKNPFPPHPARQWEEPPERPRGEDPPGRTVRASSKTRERSHGNPRGDKPHLPLDTPERLRLRTPHPVPESSKPTLILLHAGKDDAGASMPATRPSRSTFGQWTLGERVAILDMTCGRRAILYNVLHGHGGQGRLCGGGPRPCGAWRTWSPG